MIGTPQVRRFKLALDTPRRRAIAAAVAAALAAGIVVPLTRGNETSATNPLGASSFRAECATTDAPQASPAPSSTPAASKAGWTKIALRPASRCYKLTASKQDAVGVATDTTFLFEAQGAIDVATLKKRIEVQPKVPLAISAEPVKNGTTRARIRPSAPLEESALYRFTLLDTAGQAPLHSWAFQTGGPLRVVATLPRDGSAHVPLNVGIELTFSHDGVRGAEERFAISPATAGRFETHKRVLVFVPKALRPRTLYTVTLKPGANVPGSTQKIAQPVTFRFETGLGDRTGATPVAPRLQFSRAVWESPTADAPVIGLFYSDTSKPKSLSFTVHRFKNTDAFLASLDRLTRIPAWATGRESYVAPTSGLTKVTSFSAPPQALSAGDSSGDVFVRFPDRLASGFYLVRTTFNGRAIQTWLQVTDVATYAAVSKPRTLVWVNDLSTKGPVQGATIRLAKGATLGSTAVDGVSAFATPAAMLTLGPAALGEQAEVVGNLIVTAPGGKVAVVPLADLFSGFHSYEFRQYTFSGEPMVYWRFLFTDRHLYRPTDTVQAWGLVRLRESAAKAQKVTLEVLQNDYGEGGSASVARATVTTSPRGTYQAALPLEAVSVGFYELQARVGDQVLSSTYFEVEDFVKPAYKLDITPSRKAVFTGDPVRFDVAASFFEGTPVPNLDLRYADGGVGSVRTDSSGHARIDFRPSITRDACYSPIEWQGPGVSPAHQEEADIAERASVEVFPSALWGEALGTAAGKTGRVSGTLFTVDLAHINSDPAADPYDFKGGPAAGRRVSASITEVTWRKVPNGETYDFVQKIVTKNYSYERIERPHGTRSDTTDSRGRFSFSFPIDPNKSYSVAYRAADAAGRIWNECLSVYSGFEPTADFPYLSSQHQGEYAIGETVAVTMRAGERVLPSGGTNRYLYSIAQNGIREFAVRPAPAFAFTFASRHVPNVEVTAVRFTGTGYQEVGGGYSAVFDHSTRKLAVQVRPERPRYRPGETANLDVLVTDTAGRPVRAEVLLSAVDEAVYRAKPQDFFADRNILDELYDSVPGGILRVYSSHQFPTSFAGAEMGGEGGDRSNLRDVGLFRTVVTNSAGRARIPFKLPDNITSWRVTSLAVSDALQAGAAITLVPVSLPVFVDVGMNDSYLVSDRPAIQVRAFGSDLKATDAVGFTILAPTLSDRPITASGKAFAPVDMALPALREGTHKITVRVSAKGKTDGVVRSITVLPSRLLRTEAHYAEVKAGAAPFVPEGSSDRRTRVLLSDHNRGRYAPALEDLTWTRGDRIDQMIARNISQQMLARYFGGGTALPAAYRPAAYQTDKGGIAILPFADDDLAISARIAAISPGGFDRQGLIAYFTVVFQNPKETRERAIIALSGLAALGEPVLLDVRRAAVERDLSVREQLYLGLAAASAGDDDTARTLYRRLLGDHGQVRGNLVRIDAGKDQDDVLEATALGSVLGAMLADDAAPQLFEYTSKNYAEEVLVGLDRIAFMKEAIPRLPAEPVTFTYRLGGELQTVSLEGGKTLVLSLTPSERAALDLRVTQGTVGVAATFLAPFRPSKASIDREVSITRTIDGSSGPVTLRGGDVVQIVLTYHFAPKALDDCYLVSDLLPSGLRPVTRLWERGIGGGVSYPYAIEGQRVSFCAVRRGDQLPFVYYARVIGKGTYTAEPVVMQSQLGPERMALAPAAKVVIR